MPRPKATINLVNGQLGILPPSEFGSSVILIASPVAPVATYGVPFKINSKADAQTAFGQVGNEAVVVALVNGFFAEAPEGTEVWVLAMAQTTTLQTLVAAANAEKALNKANGNTRLVAAIKFPSNSYSPTITTGFDVDVHNAVTDAQTLATAWLAKNKPFRIFIEGYACDGVAANAKDYSADTKRNCLIVASEIAGSAATATLMALGRAAKVPSQQNIGRVKSGSLNIVDGTAITIGGTALASVTASAMDAYYDKRYITLDVNEDAPGYILTDDMTLTALTDDYYCLANGRVIDNMVRVAYKKYYKELKDEVDVDENGRIGVVNEKALENGIKTDVALNMPGQLSTDKKTGFPIVTCLINPDPVAYAALYAANNISSPNLNMITNGGKLYVFLSGRPKGYLKNIGIFVGFSLS